MFGKIKSSIYQHKIIAAIIAVVIAIGGYLLFQNLTATGTATQYVMGTVEKGTIISAISGTGQVSASNQVDIKSNVSGDVTAINIVAGQQVKTGDILAQIDPKNALQTLRSAQASYDNAKLSLEKLQRGDRPEELANTKLQLDILKSNVDTANSDLTKAKDQADSDLATTYKNTKTVLQDSYNKYDSLINQQLEGIYSDSSSNDPKASFLTNNSSAQNNADWKLSEAKAALASFRQLMDNYPTDEAGIEDSLVKAGQYLAIIQSFYSSLGDAVNGAIVSSNVSQANISSFKATVASAKSTINSTISGINNQSNAITSQKETNENNITSAQNKVVSSQNSYEQALNSYNLTISGADPLDLKAQQISVQQALNNLITAQQNFADYTIKAPFDGIIATVSAKNKDSISSGSAIATLITKQQVADISLNEVDVAKVKIGQKATLTFDAISDLTITGSVVSIDTIGTVSQGVVSYNVKIGLDTVDDQVKPGMSVTASIIIDSRQDALTVPTSAIKTANSVSYVEMFDSSVKLTTSTQGVEASDAPSRQTIETGLADDTNTEVTSGLKEGDRIVIKTITGTAKTKTSSAPSLLQSLGAGGRSSASSNRTSSSGNSSSKTSSGSSSGNVDSGPPPGM